MSPRLSRRCFLGTMAVPLVAGCGVSPADSHAGARSAVGCFPAAHYGIDLADEIGRALGELRVRVAGRRVLLKPNLVEYEGGSAINTEPRVVAGAAAAFLRAGAAEVLIGEGPGHRRDVEYLLEATGLDDVLAAERLRFVDLNHDEVRWVPLPSNFTGLGTLALPVSLLRADFIVSMPKLKTHHWTGLTAGMKNLFGTVPGAVYGWPKNILHIRGIHQSIVDIAAVVRPQLTIVDAITCMEGDGPIMGRPRHLGLLVMGADTVAVDATCARLIGIEPRKVPYLAMAGRFLGNLSAARTEQRGEPLSAHATEFALLDHLSGLRPGG